MIYILEVEAEGIPQHVGPFETHEEAYRWALQHVPNGSWCVIPLAHPERTWS